MYDALCWMDPCPTYFTSKETNKTAGFNLQMRVQKYGKVRKTGNKKVLLVLQHCCETGRKAMLRVLPTLNHAKKFATNSPISLILNFKSRDMSHDHDYTFGTERPQDTHLRKILSFDSWYPSERYCKTSIFFLAIFVKLTLFRPGSLFASCDRWELLEPPL